MGDFECNKEWSDIHEQQVSGKSRSSFLKQTVACYLSYPPKEMQSKEEMISAAIQNARRVSIKRVDQNLESMQTKSSYKGARTEDWITFRVNYATNYPFKHNKI